MKVRPAIGALMLVGLTAVPAFSVASVASAAPITQTQTSTAESGIPAGELPSPAEQARIQSTIKRVGPTLKDGQTVLVDTYRGVPIYVQNRSGLVQVQVGGPAKKAGGIQPQFSFCSDIEVPAVLAAIAAAGGVAAILTGGIVLPEYGIVITAAQLQAAAAGTSLVAALYNVVKGEIC